MMQKPKPARSLGEEVNIALNVFLFVASAFTLSGIGVLHKQIGIRYIGRQSLLTLFVMLFWAFAWPQNDPGSGTRSGSKFCHRKSLGGSDWQISGVRQSLATAYVRDR